MPKPRNYGLILERPKPKDWWYGGVSGIDNSEVLRADGQWDSYLPAYEPQSQWADGVYFDSQACVSFSADNCLETLAYRKYNFQPNFSDRAVAKMSGTTPEGNTFSNVGDSIRNDGLLAEIDWPFAPWIKSFSGYYADIPLVLIDKAKGIYDTYKLNYEFVWDTPESLMDALQYAPLQVAIHAYGPVDGDVFQRTTLPGNHAVMLYGCVTGQYWKIYDHYDWKYKKLAWDTRFWGAVKYSIEKVIPNPPPPMVFTNGTILQLVEGKGGFLVKAADRLYYDEEAKILATWVTINSKDYGDGEGRKFREGRSDVVTLKELEGIQLYDLKNNPVSL